MSFSLFTPALGNLAEAAAQHFHLYLDFFRAFEELTCYIRRRCRQIAVVSDDEILVSFATRLARTGFAGRGRA